jgi:glycerol 3-phosphatase-2
MTGPSPGLLGTERPLTELFDVLLLDLDGVVYIGPDAVPGAAQALARARADGVRASFVTNNASRPAPTVAAHLRELGIDAADDEVVTSAQAAAGLLAARLPAGAPVLVVGGEGLDWALRQEGLTPVRSMDDVPQAVVQGFSPDVGWRQLAEGTRAVNAGLPWIATNTDLTVPTPHGRAPGNGTLVAAVATATGITPEVAGKPQPPLFLDAVRRSQAARPLVVGDRLDTDLEGAVAAGIPGLVVLTGVCTGVDLLRAAPHERPQLIGRDLGCLTEVHPRPEAADGAWRCGKSTVTDGGAVAGTGDDPIDLLRAACAAFWAAVDAGGPAPDPGPVTDALRTLDRGGPWGR